MSEERSTPAEALNLDIMAHDTPAPEASDITDITWDMMSGAGIDIGLVDEHPDGTCYVYQHAGLRIAFGPGTALAGEIAAGEPAPKGWDVSVSQAYGDGEWFDSGQNWLPTAAAAVEYVALVINGR